MNRICGVTFLILLCLSAATANQYYVNAATGSDTTGNGSLANPWKTITYALDQISGTGHTLNVAAGTYNTSLGETFPILMKNGVSIVGTDANVCVLDAAGTNTVIRCVGITDGTTKIEGLTIKGGGNVTQGGGIYISAGSVLLVTKCRIVSNMLGSDVESGGGIYVTNASPVILNDTISANKSGGIYVNNGSPLIKGNSIVNNQGVQASGIFVTGASSTPRIVGNIISKNSSSVNTMYGIGCSALSHARIINNTISDNVGGIFIDGASPDSIENNIIAFNSNYGILENTFSSDPGRAAYNLFFQNGSGLYRDENTTDYYSVTTLNGTVPECSANLDGDPKFNDRTNGDYHLRTGSAAFDAGNPNAAFNDPDGTRSDIGALFFDAPPSTPSSVSAIRGNAKVQLIWRANPEPDVVRYRVYYGTSPVPTTKMDSTSSATDTSRTYALTNNTTYYFRVTAVDAVGNVSGYSTEVSATPVVAVNGEYLADASTALLLHINEGSGSAVGDASVNASNGTATGTTIVTGRFGSARSYTAGGDQITVPHAATLNFGSGPFTVESWINTTAVSTHPHFKMDIPLGKGWYTGLGGDGSFHVRAMINSQDTWTNGQGKIVNDGKWHHIAAVFTPSSIRSYVDGVLIDTATIQVPGSMDNSENLTIGSSWNSFRGTLDEVRISSVARSPGEFNLLLSPKNVTANASGTAITPTWQSGGGVATFMRYRIYRGMDSTNVSLVDSTTLTSITHSGLASGTRYFYRIAAVDSFGYEYVKSFAANAVTASAPGEYTPDAYTVLLLHMNEPSGSAVTDASGSNNNGSAYGTTLVSGRTGKARSYASSGDQINIPHSATLNFGTSSFTLEAWVNTQGYTNNGGHPFHKRGSPNNRGWMIDAMSDGSISGWIGNASDQTGSGFNGRLKINDGAWHHVAVVVTQTLITTYIDGQLDNMSTVWTAGTPDNDGTLNIGSSWNGFRGLLDEIRISNKARTPDEFNLQLPPKQCTASASSNAIALAWQQGGGLTPLMRYRIYRGTDSVNVTRLDSTTASSYLDLTATPGTFYFYRLAAVDSIGFESARSIAVCSEVLLAGEYQVDTSTVFLMHLNQTGGINVGDVGRNGSHGQFNGGSFVSGRFGNAFQAGSSGGIWAQSFSTAGMENQFTVEAWVKLTSKPTCWLSFISMPWMNFNLNPDAQFFFNSTLADGSGRGLWPGNTTLTIGRWNHLAFVFNSGNATLYLNGELISSDSYGQSIRTGSGGFGMVSYNPPDVFPGLIDEVRISKVARKPNEFGFQMPPANLEASQLGSSVHLQWQNGGGGVPCMRYRIYRGTDSLNVSVIDSTTSLSCNDTKATAGTSYVYRITAVDSTGFESAMSRSVAYSKPLAGEYQVDSTAVFLMHMNGASGTIVADVGPYRFDGQTNSGTFVSGRFGSAYVPGNTGGLQLQNIPSIGLENKLTIEAWIKFSQAPRAFSRILQIPNVEIRVNSGYFLDFTFRLDDGSWPGVGTQLNAECVGKWIHIAATFDNGVASLYVNSARRSSWSFGHSLMTSWGGGCIGQSDGGQIFTGAIDEVRISNVARPPSEFGMQLPPKDVSLTRTSSAVHLQWQNGGGNIPLMRYKIYRGTDSLNVSVIDSTDGLSYEDRNISTGRFYCYRISAVDSTGFDNNEGQNVFASIPMVGEYEPDTSTVLLMHYNQPGATIAFDVSRNAYHGQGNGGSFVDGRFGKAYRPANTNGISVSTLPSLGLENRLTLEAWIKLESPPTDRIDIVSMPNMWFHLNSDYSFSFDFLLSDGNWGNFGTGSAQVTVGPWYHVACTFDNGVASIFVNGTRRGINSRGQSIATATGGGSIARMYSEGSFSGLIDEVRISKVARQPSEFGFQFPPKELTATVSNSTVRLSWQNGGGGVPLIRYRIHKGADSLNVSLIDSTNALSYDDGNIVVGKTYCYRVSAVDSSGFEISKGNSVYAIIPLLGEYAVDTATVLLMHFDQDSGVVAGDVGPYGYRGQVNGGSFVNGRFGKAFQPSNTNGISVPSLPSFGLENQLTIEAWVKLTGNPNDWCNILGFPYMNIGINTDLSVGIGLTLEDWRGGGAGTPSYVLTVGKWYHIAGTFENGTSKIYVNGVLLGSYTSGQSLRTGTGGGSIATSNNNNVFPGLIDEVRILRRALRPDEFGLQLPPTSLTASQSGSTIHLEWKNGGGGIPCMRYRIYRGADSLNVSVIDSTTNLVYDDSKTAVGSSYVYRVAAVDSTGFENTPSFAASIAIPLAGEYRADTTTVLMMHMNQSGGSIVTDVGPYGYHGLVSGGTYVDGRFGKSYQPANTNGIWLRNISTAAMGGQITVEAWIKPSGLPNDWSAIVAIPWINIHLNTDLSASMDLGFTDGTGGGIGTSSYALTVGRWSHVAGTYDNAVAKIYINGVLQSSRFVGQTLGTGPGSGSIATSNNNNTFPGLIDEIRISRVAFQPTQFGLQLPPANLSAAQSGGNIRLEWKNGGGGIPCMRYRIYRGTDSANVSTIDSTTNLLYNDATAQAGKFYFYRVGSVDSTGFEGAKSFAIKAIVPLAGECRPDTSTVVLMHMDQDSGLGLYDASMNNYHGQMSVGSFVPGRFGNAFQPGSSDGMWFNSISTVGMEKEFTIELWVKFADIQKFNSRIINIPWMFMNINQDFSFNLNFCLEDGSWGGAWSPSFVLSVGKWYHLAGVFDNGSSKLYVNGVLLDSRYYDQSVRTSPGGGNMANYNSPDILPALVDEVRISKIARRPDEFGLQLPPTDLSATIQATSIKLSWQNGGGAIPCMRYKIYRGLDSLNVLLKDSTANLSYDDTTAVRGIFYIYRVAAVDSTGFEGAKSSAFTATMTAMGEYQPDTSTVLLLHLNGTGATTAYDASRYGNHGRLDKTTPVSGRFGNAKQFDDQSYIHIPHSTSVDIGDNDFTLEAWVNIGKRSDWSGIFYKWGSDRGFHFYISGSEGTLRMHLRSDATTYREVNSISRLDDSKWHHVATMRQNNLVSIFIDGALEGSVDVAPLGTTANFGEITIHRGIHLLDEVRISNRARSLEEFDFQLPPKNLRVTASGSKANLTWQQGGGIVPLSKYKIYRGFDPSSLTLYDSTASTSFQDAGLLAGAKYYYRVAAVDSTGFESARSSPASLIHSVVVGEYVPDSSTVLLLHMDEPTGSNVGDASFSNNDGKATGTTAVVGRFGKARSYSASGDEIDVPDSTSLDFGTGSYTLEVWINTLGYTPAGHPFHKRGSPGNRGWITYVYSEGATGAWIANVSDQTSSAFTGTNKINDGQWHHVAVVVTQSNITNYIDGVLDVKISVTTPGTPDNDGGLVLGSSWNSFRGLLDEVRISKKARTPKEFNLQLRPLNLTAGISATSISLAWQSGGGACPLMRHRIYRGADSTTMAAIDSTVSTAYVNTGLAVGTKYYYRIAAVDSSGFESVKSFATSATTQNIPTAPSGLTPTALSFSRVNLSWTDNSNNEDGFKIERKTGSSGTYAQITTVAANVKTFQDTGLTALTQYYYRVSAFNAAGTSSTSLEANVTTPAQPDVTAPGSPISPSITSAGWTSAHVYTLSWTNPSDASGIAKVWYRYDRPPTTDTLGTSLTFTVASGVASAQVPAPATCGAHLLYFYLEDGVSPTGNKNPSSCVSVIAKHDDIPPTIGHDSLSVAGFTISSPQDISISATASDAHSGVKSLQLQYKKAGSSWTSPHTVNYAPTGGSAVIRASDITAYSTAGVDYRIVGTDTADNVSTSSTHSLLIQHTRTYARLDASGNSITQMSVTQLPSSVSSQMAYRMFSVPLKLNDETPRRVLEKETGLPAYDNTEWRFFRLNANNGYDEYPSFADESAIKPGSAFFLILNSGKTPMAGTGTVVKAEDINKTGIQLRAGYNFVGNPFNFEVSIDSSLSLSGTESLTNRTWEFVGVSGTNSGWKPNPTVLKPWEGIVVKLTSAAVLRFNIVDGPSSTVADKPIAMKSKKAVDDAERLRLWKLKVVATREDNKIVDSENFFGVDPSATDSADMLDMIEPPMIGDKGLSLASQCNEELLTHDYRAAGNEGYVWDLKLRTSDRAARVRLSIEGAANLSSEVFLVDIDSKIAYRPKTASRIEVNSGNGIRRFRLIVGNLAFAEQNSLGVEVIPREFALFQNYPNPFNPVTMIRYTLPSSEKAYRVSLKIYNLLGNEIAKLVDVDQSAGYYEVRFDGTGIATGTYFYRIDVSGGSREVSFRDAKKFILMK